MGSCLLPKMKSDLTYVGGFSPKHSTEAAHGPRSLCRASNDHLAFHSFLKTNDDMSNDCSNRQSHKINIRNGSVVVERFRITISPNSALIGCHDHNRIRNLV